MSDEEDEERPYKDSAERAEKTRDRMLSVMEKVADSFGKKSDDLISQYVPPPPPTPEQIESSKKDERNFNIRQTAIVLFQRGASADVSINSSIDFFDKLDAVLPVQDRSAMMMRSLFALPTIPSQSVQEELDSMNKGE